MGITISQKYLKSESDYVFYGGIMTKALTIAPPEKVPELEGYVMRVSQDAACMQKTSIRIIEGNEWNPKAKKRYYMFEKEEKIPGQKFKKYRYDEEELIFLYGCASSATFEEKYKHRISIISHGRGKLIKAEFNEYSSSYHTKQLTTDWMIAPDDDKKWAYELNYDPLRDQGKHDKTVSSFRVLEECEIDDLSILNNSIKTALQELLNEYDQIKKSEKAKPVLTAEAITLMLKDACVQSQWRNESEYDQTIDIINKVSNEIADNCAAMNSEYIRRRGEEIARKIKEISGLDICFSGSSS